MFFKEDFKVLRGEEPANWYVEKNSDLPFSAFRCDGEKITLLSPGNKYVPLTHPFTDGTVRFKLGVNLMSAGCFDISVCFRYDLYTMRGECIRFRSEKGSSAKFVEFGINYDNTFMLIRSFPADIPDETFDTPVEIAVCFNGPELRAEIAGRKFVTGSAEPPQAGYVAMTRGSSFGTEEIYNFEIEGGIETPNPEQVSKFRIELPDEPFMVPLICDVELRDFGHFIEAALTIGGGVKTTSSGEGNYHVMRTDVIVNPYFKLITRKHIEKFILYNGRILWVNEEIAPAYFYKTLQKHVEWPYTATVRFIKPEEESMYAVGADSLYCTTWAAHQLEYGEALFNAEGKILASGRSLFEHNGFISFESAEKKAMLKRLPKDDPRYEKAVEFVKNNHYFIEGEDITFKIVMRSLNMLPASAVITLENAFFEPLKTLSSERSIHTEKIGILNLNMADYTLSVESLTPGVYHLRCESNDESVPPLENYCAFEVMSKEKNAPCPPVISGIPYLYNGRTETRGLDTDSFDPWHGKSFDDGHYMSCINFLPVFTRKFKVAQTVHAYGREWFAWFSARCCDDPSIGHNSDLIREADYMLFPQTDIIWLAFFRYLYTGDSLDLFIRFAEQTRDTEYDLEKLHRLLKEGKPIDIESLIYTGEHHWSEWLEFMQSGERPKMDALTKQCLEANPHIKFSGYGPGAIYASHYKGCEFKEYYVQPQEKDIGFFQLEDYPLSCNYGIERGTYYLTSCLLLLMPGTRIYPEVYMGVGLAGCPDGAVHYAFPPYGLTPPTPPEHTKRRLYDYALASAYFRDGKFDYWQNAGFQACGFDRPQFEAVLKSWRNVMKHPPAHPMKSTAFVYSFESWKADSGQTVIKNYVDAIIDVRKTVVEDVPFVYEEARQEGISAGFLTFMEEIPMLTKGQVDTLVLPPLEGVSERYISAIRKLHEQGVNLVAFENVPGLEDLFGVEDTGEYRRAENLKGTSGFLSGMREHSDEEKCIGRYRTKGATILVDSEIPVLMLKKNGIASAAFFNVPPTVVNDDRHVRLGYGRDSISPIINAAVRKVMRMFDDSPARISEGHLIAYTSKNDEDILVVTNPDGEHFSTPILTFRKSDPKQKPVYCEKPFTVLSENDSEIKLRFKLEANCSAMTVFMVPQD